jgi:alpha-N-arabinofuranosidase
MVTVLAGCGGGGGGSATLLDAQTLSDDDFYAANTLTQKERVGMEPNKSVIMGDGGATLTLPPVSWTALSFG